MLKMLYKYLFLYFHNKKNRRRIESLDVSLNAKFGNYVIIGKNSMIDDNTVIGEHTFVGKNCNITKAVIGRYCSIANNVSIGQGEHDLERISTSSLFYSNGYETLTKQPCNIGNDVWIGTDSIILRGVQVSDGAVIGANSVVTKDIPRFAIAVGSPAKVIRYRFEPEMIDKVINSKWWDKELGGAKVLIKELEKLC